MPFSSPPETQTYGALSAALSRHGFKRVRLRRSDYAAAGIVSFS